MPSVYTFSLRIPLCRRVRGRIDEVVSSATGISIADCSSGSLDAEDPAGTAPVLGAGCAGGTTPAMDPAPPVSGARRVRTGAEDQCSPMRPTGGRDASREDRRTRSAAGDAVGGAEGEDAGAVGA